MTARLWASATLLCLIAPLAAAGQDRRVSVQAGIGGLTNTGGGTQSASLGFLPGPRLGLLIGVEHSHRPTKVSPFLERGDSATYVSGEVRFLPLGHDRVSPYGLVSIGRGRSRPDVNQYFPTTADHAAWLVLYFGGGVHVPMTHHLSAFADLRFGIQGEQDTIFLLIPLRGGIAWRF